MNRRDFLKTVVRGIILSGIMLLVGQLLFKNKGEKSCDFLCRNCKKLNSCTLPEAVKFKPKY
jgi:hypothetical protein